MCPHDDMKPITKKDNPKNEDVVANITGMTSEKELRAALGNGVRITSQGYYSIIDVIYNIYGCTKKQASDIFFQNSVGQAEFQTICQIHVV